MKLFTLMTCTYNHADFLEPALNNMLALDKISEYVEKIIIVDNASTDTTYDVAMNYINRFPHLISYIYEPIPGVTYARKHAKDIKTPWLIFVDDDNLLSHDYLTVLVDLIENNLNVGVINSAGIASPIADCVFNSEQQNKLKTVFPALACTHSSIESYLSGEKAQVDSPFGAGVALRISPIKKLAENGWTKNEGRKSGTLTSGEDGEIICSVLKEGFDYLFTDKTYFLHIIQPERLEEAYLLRLFAGIGHGMFLCDKQYGIIKIIFHALKNCLKMIYEIITERFSIQTSKKLEWHYKFYTWRAYNKCVLGKAIETEVKKKL